MDPIILCRCTYPATAGMAPPPLLHLHLRLVLSLDLVLALALGLALVAPISTTVNDSAHFSNSRVKNHGGLRNSTKHQSPPPLNDNAHFVHSRGSSLIMDNILLCQCTYPATVGVAPPPLVHLINYIFALPLPLDLPLPLP